MSDKKHKPHIRLTSPGFAPSDLSDGRKQYDWESGYPKAATRQMWIEAIYLLLILILVPALLSVVGAGCIERSIKNIDTESIQKFRIYANAWLGGTLGGTLFSLKWLYHSRAKGFWTIDRQFWRLFTPHLSGGLSFGFIVLISSGLLVVFDQEKVSSPSVTLGIAFIVGYFSDKAIAKLAEVADTLFGSQKNRDLADAHRRDTDNKDLPETDQDPNQ